MKKEILIYIFLFSLLIMGCSTKNSIVNFVKEGGLETKGLINIASSSNGATVAVSQENPERPASKLIDGITSSENWDQGEGWETQYEGFYARGEYVGYGVEDPMVVMEQMRNRNRNDDDNEMGQSLNTESSEWRGLRTQTRYGNIDTAMGWVVIDFPEDKLVNRAIVYTVDSKKYPADKFGIADLSLQYWTNSAKSWATVERIGKTKNQLANSINDNKNGVITIRFQPVQTSRMRFIIKWTNDSKSVRRGYYQYTMGKIRIAEIEIYGYEKSETPELREAKKIASIQDANANAEILAIIDNYVDGYNRKDIEIAMSSISQNYSKDGESISDLKSKLESVFSQYQNLRIKLSNIEINVDINDAIAKANYSAQQDSISSSGNIIFKLSKSSGNWRITSMSLQ